MSLSRRRMVAGLGALAAGPVLGDPLIVPPSVAPERLARDEPFWAAVARQFRVSAEFVNLENGYYGIMPEPVRRAYLRNVDHLNEVSSYLLRTTYKAQADQVRQRIAALLGVAMEEIALTRGGTEALQNLIAGYRGLRPGDAVMYADLDYHSAQYAMNWLRDRRTVRVERLVIPEPATRQAVLDTYAQALREHPRVKLLLLSHMNNRTGLVLPVKQIIALARAHGVDVIVDAAHSWGQLDFTIADLDAEFAVFSLHKWMGAPLGAGFLYIRQDRLADIDRVFADETYPAQDIRSRVHSGTMNVAPILTVGAALDFHDALGGARKQARLRYLRDRWVHQVRDVPGMEILTPEDPAMYGAITAFRVSGRTSEADNVAITDHLMSRHRIFTVRRGGVSAGDCVRVTPALFTSTDDVDRLALALRDIAGSHLWSTHERIFK
ncbi:aminotransferase class V-fold PLP-dependent enzyme [Nonomuraea sp. NEAU-A123]|uniref:aminotransferase class V-fold PLP-dependent enzyme n=1 Tax=Nonomuraea sp. NEAU-A123 TaxID=2839649 RepID=UPI001BE43219|nr:aminotransferase class V-fold PLP-dependent enzyme [Nonomuraea sp. NEAU-A123]MBT2227703.1 aminotransferase class V-fold PLP-dependent enzyme [Nonomuraea sp. NEAU-A123]